jgi:hypothetical protein
MRERMDCMAGVQRALEATSLATEGAKETAGHGVCVTETRLTTVKLVCRNSMRIAESAAVIAKGHVDRETVTIGTQTAMLNGASAARTSEGSGDEAATRQTVARATGARAVTVTTDA